MHDAVVSTAAYALPAALAGLKTLIPFAGMTVPFASTWTSHDGRVRGHFDTVRNLVYVEADFGHDPADVRWAWELLESRGWEPVESPWDDELLDDGVRVYFARIGERN